MFALFERLLTPTAAPENPEPPANLIPFLWHFARQAKWLFAALFVVELMSALSDSAVPWFMGRIVTIVTKTPPARLFAEDWPWLVGIAAFVVIVRPAITLTALPDLQPGHRGAVHRPYSLAVALARGAPELGVLSERFRRPHFQSRHADRAVGAFDADSHDHDRLVHHRVWRVRDRTDGGGGSLARAADRAVVFRLRGAARLFRAAHARALEGVVHRALDADGAHRRQLHQHSHGQALRACARGGRVCARRGR